MAGGMDDLEKASIREVNDIIQHPTVATRKDEEIISEKNAGTYEDSEGSERRASEDAIELAPVGATSQVSRTKSRASSVPSRMTIVPRSKRRGLLGQLTIIPEIERPREYGRGTKWFITFLIAIAATAAPMGSSIFYLALYMLSMSIFPLWWSSFSETLGRRTIYLVSFTLFTIFGILSAVSTSIGMLIAMRMLSGGAAASVQAVGAGTVADIWEVEERGRAIGIFYLGPLMGPLLAPIIGGVLAEFLGWRSTQWFLVIYGAILIVLLTFCLPETLASSKPAIVPPTLPSHETKSSLQPKLTRTSTPQSVQVKAKSYISVLNRCFFEPLAVLYYLRFPAVALTVYYASITFGSLYVLNISVQQTFSAPPYSFSTIIVGLLYIPNSLGYVVVSIFGGKWIDNIMAREARKANRYDERGKLIYIPEDRMRENVWLGAIMYPAALVVYGWTADKGVFWLVPMIANFFFGIGSMLIFGAATTMLTEFMPKKSSSGVAVNNFVRNIFSCVGGIVASPLINAIGDDWVFTGLGIICLSSSGIIYAMGRFGPKWRVEMDKKINGR
ncbi:MAG: hypothetical protein M1818_004447 [Claussenomyces sp. TS43310]|nr:MAG: hypothetical protein M1818_004447 [Claussenomyces sp. TS43310]